VVIMPARKTKPRAAARPHRRSGLSERPTWQGHLKLSLVSCAVGLYRATTTSNDVSFHLVNPKTGNRIRLVPTDPDTGPVDRAKLVKGYPVEKDKYVLFSEDELDDVKLETTRTLDIERFVDARSIDRLYWDTPYVLLPTEDNSTEAYHVIQQAMAEANVIALGRVTMHTRERLMAVEPRDNGLIATTLRTRDEVVNLAGALESLPRGKPDKRMIDIATRIIEQKKDSFDPDTFTDRYEDALRELIAEKKRGHKIKRVEEPKDTGNVIDLMQSLQRSLRAEKSDPPKKAARVIHMHRRKAAR
jgi:DNA end-binding protein Ku